MKLISVVTPVYNEQANVRELYERVKKRFGKKVPYKYEHVFIDNCSTDDTASILRMIAKQDKNVKVILNSRNFGWLRSPMYGLFQAKGNAVIFIPCDLQDPPELIDEFIRKWEEGNKIVIGVKTKSRENPLAFFLRKMYYVIIRRFSETDHIDNYYGFGLYDQKIIQFLKSMDDPYPYLRGMVAEIGFERCIVEYTQQKRNGGKSSSSLYKLYDVGMLGFVNYSKIPLRAAAFSGFVVGAISFILAAVYFVLKIVYWDKFQMGTAPILIGIFFFSSVQLFFIGILGEYIGAIYTQVKKRPLVFEKERINF